MQVACSILSIVEEMMKKNTDCKPKVDALNDTDCDYFHLDIMDGEFVEMKTLKDAKTLELVKDIQKPFDIHIMVKDIGKYIEIYKEVHPRYLTFHYEATSNPDLWIRILKKYGIGVGISIKPSTPVSALLPYLEKLDLVLVMGVEPGKGGQTFLDSSIAKLKQLKQLRNQNGYHYQIEVDGGINAKTIDKVKNADIVVSGSFVTNADDYQKQIDLLRT